MYNNGNFIKVKMLQTRKAPMTQEEFIDDYREGEEYLIEPGLAKVFIEQNFAKKIENEKTN